MEHKLCCWEYPRYIVRFWQITLALATGVVAVDWTMCWNYIHEYIHSGIMWTKTVGESGRLQMLLMNHWLLWYRQVAGTEQVNEFISFEVVLIEIGPFPMQTPKYCFSAHFCGTKKFHSSAQNSAGRGELWSLVSDVRSWLWCYCWCLCVSTDINSVSWILQYFRNTVQIIMLSRKSVQNHGRKTYTNV